MVLTVYFVLSPAIGLSCHRRWRLHGLTNPVGLAGHHQLDAGVEASGPHDFSVRDRSSPEPSTGVVPIRRSSGAGRISIGRPRAFASLTGKARPATSRAPDAAASTASHPASVTIANRPSCGVRRREL